MNWLLIAATEFEIKLLRTHVMEEKNIDTLISGIGGTITAYTLLTMLSIKKYDIIIQAGIAGSVTKKLSLGDTVVVTADFFGDMGVVEHKKRRTVFDLGLIDPTELPFKHGWLENTNTDLIKATGLKMVKGVSVNEITTKKSTIAFFKGQLNAEIESMEGAAFHYTCLMEGIPFLQIRSISNYVGERDKKKWAIKTAIENLNSNIIKLLQQMN